MNKIVILVIALMVCLSACNTAQQSGENEADMSKSSLEAENAESEIGDYSGITKKKAEALRAEKNRIKTEEVPDAPNGDFEWYNQGTLIGNMEEWMEEQERIKTEKNAPEPDEPGIWQEQGLTKKEWEDFREEKARFEAATDEGRAVALESGIVMCRNFTHLWWEASISTEFILHVGEEAFEEWWRANEGSAECISIYSFADYFGFDLDTLKAFIIENKLEEIYPLDRLEARYNYFHHGS